MTAALLKEPEKAAAFDPFRAPSLFNAHRSHAPVSASPDARARQPRLRETPARRPAGPATTPAR